MGKQYEEVTIQHQFDALIKTVLKHEAKPPFGRAGKAHNGGL